MNKYRGPEHLAPAPSKTPEEVHQLLGKCKPLWQFAGLSALKTTTRRLCWAVLGYALPHRTVQAYGLSLKIGTLLCNFPT